MWKRYYGPYGNPTGSETVTINGTITGFYGYENERINALGFYKLPWSNYSQIFCHFFL
jgi:hypothetical protein